MPETPNKKGHSMGAREGGKDGLPRRPVGHEEEGEKKKAKASDKAVEGEMESLETENEKAMEEKRHIRYRTMKGLIKLWCVTVIAVSVRYMSTPTRVLEAYGNAVSAGTICGTFLFDVWPHMTHEHHQDDHGSHSSHGSGEEEGQEYERRGDGHGDANGRHSSHESDQTATHGAKEGALQSAKAGAYQKSKQRVHLCDHDCDHAPMPMSRASPGAGGGGHRHDDTLVPAPARARQAKGRRKDSTAGICSTGTRHNPIFMLPDNVFLQGAQLPRVFWSMQTWKLFFLLLGFLVLQHGGHDHANCTASAHQGCHGHEDSSADDAAHAHHKPQLSWIAFFQYPFMADYKLPPEAQADQVSSAHKEMGAHSIWTWRRWKRFMLGYLCDCLTEGTSLWPK
jgi:hypothetical protein